MELRIVCVCPCMWGCKGLITVGHSWCLANYRFAISTVAAEWVGSEGGKSRPVYSVGIWRMGSDWIRG